MLYTALGPDRAEIEDGLIAPLFQGFCAFLDATFHPHTLLAGGLHFEKFGDLFQTRDLILTSPFR